MDALAVELVLGSGNNSKVLPPQPVRMVSRKKVINMDFKGAPLFLSRSNFDIIVSSEPVLQEKLYRFLAKLSFCGVTISK